MREIALEWSTSRIGHSSAAWPAVLDDLLEILFNHPPRSLYEALCNLAVKGFLSPNLSIFLRARGHREVMVIRLIIITV